MIPTFEQLQTEFKKYVELDNFSQKELLYILILANSLRENYEKDSREMELLNSFTDKINTYRQNKQK